MTASRVIAALAATLAASSLAACESTQDTSERMAKQAKDVAKESGVTIGRENASISVTGSAVVHDANGTAAVVLLRNGPHPAQGRALMDYLLSAAVELRLARDAAQMPVRSDVVPPDGVRRVDEIRAMRVDYAALGALMERVQPWLRNWAGL